MTEATVQDIEQDAIETLEVDLLIWQAIHAQRRPVELQTFKGTLRGWMVNR
jgi:hypothetical protein